jgi:hypothetical protein
MLNKYLILLIILLILIFLIIFINYLLKKYKKNNYLENFSGTNKKNIENENIHDLYELDNNLIKNGNFENGNNILNHSNQNGFNKIIMMKNPGKTSYVLNQKKGADLTFYEINSECDENSRYNLYFWLCVSDNINNKNNIDELNFEKLINIKMQNSDFSNFIPRLNYNIIQSVILNNDENNWYLLKYDFISNNSGANKIQIYLNYSDDLQYDNYYFTDISLYKVLIDAENFIYNDKLICYGDGYHYETNILTWHDLSGKGNDLFFSTMPLIDYTKGSININNLKINGFSSNKISNNNFSILICLNKNYENSASDIEVDDKNNLMKFYLLSVPGNDNYSFELEIRDNFLYLICGNKEYRTHNEIVLYNKTLISLTYNNGHIIIYQDGVVLISEEISKVYFNNNKIVINKNKNLDINLYSMLVYDRTVNRKELNDIREYFITNKNKNFNNPDINNHHMNNNAEYTINNDKNYLFKPYNKHLNETYNNFKNNNFSDTFDNQNNFMKSNDALCKKECENLCKNLLDKNNMDKYNYCINHYKSNLLSCNKNNGPININIDFNEDIVKKNGDDIKNCPKVYKKDNKFMVHIDPNSEYSKKLQYSGEKAYGENIEKARYLYNLNFPKCPTPSEFLIEENKKHINTCPFIVHEANPCYTNTCAGVNWDVKDYKDLQVSDKCKKVISTYCQINYELDDNCKCWNPKYKEDQNCIDYRRHFENPNDYCSPSQFKIEEHPEFSKYIKKDNIPCWGCKLD